MGPETSNPTSLSTSSSNHGHSSITNNESLAFELSIATNYEDFTTALTSTFRETPSLHTNEKSKFQESCLKEITGLTERGIFTPVHKSEVKENGIYESRFEGSIKNEGISKAYKESRLEFQSFNDKREVLTQAPTVQRAFKSIQLSLPASDSSLKNFFSVVSQACIQSRTKKKTT